MTADLHDLGGSLLRQALAQGATAADVVAVAGSSISVDVRAGALENAERAEGIDLGLRVFVDQKQAIVSASDHSEKTMSDMVERALAMAREAPDDPYAGLADPSDLAQGTLDMDLELAAPAPDPSPAEVAPDAHIVAQPPLASQGLPQGQAAYAGYGTHELCLH